MCGPVLPTGRVLADHEWHEAAIAIDAHTALAGALVVELLSWVPRRGEVPIGLVRVPLSDVREFGDRSAG